MQQYFFICLVLFCHATSLFGQSEQPSLLHQPSDWRFEKIDLPMGFAPEMTVKGYEELRFSAGWSKPDTPNYFSYAFALYLENEAKFKKKKIETFLTQYYRGLSAVVASGKEFDVKVEDITVDLKKQGKGRYHIELVFLDSFNEGQAVNLHMEMWVYPNRKAGTSKVISIVSSQDKDAPIWDDLRTLRKQAVAGF